MLTNEQKAILKSYILNDPILSAFPNNSDGGFAIAAILNLPASPTFFIWRNLVSTSEIMGNGFDWARVDNIENTKARIWEWMTSLGTISPSQANVRAGINQAFPTLANSAMRLSIFGHCQVSATTAEKLFAVGAGTTTTDAGVGPATPTFTGMLSYNDVQDARNS